VSENFNVSDALTAFVSLLVGAVGSLVAFKGNKNSAETNFRDDLLQLIKQHSERISALEEDNRRLSERNQELVQLNAQLTAERQALISRVDHLEKKLAEMSEKMEHL
jgi:small-conductance mechanosensitive channel